MKKINLREYYPDSYTKDEFILVEDEVAETLEKSKREEKAYIEKVRYHKAYYSLEAGEGIESSILESPPKPDEVYEDMEFLRLFFKAMESLPETERRRVYDYLINGISQTEIAKRDHVDKSAVSHSIRRGLMTLKKFFK